MTMVIDIIQSLNGKREDLHMGDCDTTGEFGFRPRNFEIEQ